MSFSMLVSVIVCLSTVQYAKTSINFIEDYCWRDYNGITPSDAFKAGVDRNGRPIYIGQTLYNNRLIPGKIHENVNEIHIEWFEAFLINETIKILCTEHPENFEWYKTRYDQVIKIKDKHLFEGGYEKGVTTYIGRATSHGELTVGKVICWTTYCIRLTTIENGTWYPHEEFEILTYKDQNTTSAAPNHNSGGREGPSFLTIFLILLALGVLVTIVVVLVKRC